MYILVRIIFTIVLLWATISYAQFNGCPTGFCNLPPISSSSGCAQATTFLARTSLTAPADNTYINAYTNLICGLVTNNLLSAFDILYMTATKDDPTGRFNLISSSFSLVNSDASTAPIFTQNRGFKYNGGACLNTQFNPSSAPSPNYVQNSAHGMVWTNEIGNGSGEFGDGTGASTLVFIVGAAASNLNITVNTGFLGFISTTPTGAGFYLGSRDNSTTRTGYWAAPNTAPSPITNLGTANSGTTTGVPSGNVYVVCTNGVNSSNKTIAAASAGRALSAAEAAIFYSLVQNFMTAVGNT